MALILHKGAVKVSAGIFGGLCKITSKHKPSITQVAFITSRDIRGDRPPKPPPFDYRHKLYRSWDVFFDPMEKRFDDNSKVITVDGLPGAGKHKFCEKLAEELEMYHMPQMTYDIMHVDQDGFDYRSLNHKLPEDAQYFDINDFLRKPKGINSCAIQMNQYLMRYWTYMDALAHVFNTGQGVVLERSPWSDIVFTKAMRACDYISPMAYDYCWSTYNNSLHRLLRPHVQIYLDVPVDAIKANIQKRAHPHEKDAPALTTQYLSEMERAYKEFALPLISQHAHLLIYDWQEEGYLSDVIDDIEALDCEPDNFDREVQTLQDWRFAVLDEARGARAIYTNNKMQMIFKALVGRWDVPEMICKAEHGIKHTEVMDELYEEHPSKQYARGFDTAAWWKVLWKSNNTSDDLMPIVSKASKAE